MTGSGDHTTGWGVPNPEHHAAAPQPGVPGSVTAAAVILFVMAALIGLLAAVLLLTSSMMSGFPGDWMLGPGFESVSDPTSDAFMDATAGFLIVFAVIMLGVAVGHVLAGIGVLRRRGWARIVGLVLSALALLLLLLGIAGSLIALAEPIPYGVVPPGFTEESMRQDAIFGAIFGLVTSGAFLLGYLYVVIVLARRGDVFI